MRLDMEGTLVASGTLAQPTVGRRRQPARGRRADARPRARARERGPRRAERLPGRDARRRLPGRDVRERHRDRRCAPAARSTTSSSRSTPTAAACRRPTSSRCCSTGRTAAAAASEGGVVVAEQLAMALGGVLQKGVGETLLIDVAPDRSLLSDDIDPTQRLHLGTRITQNLTVLYSAALDGTEQRWIVELNPGGGRFRFRAITEEDNTFSVEGTDRFSFELWNRGRVGKAPREVERLASLSFDGTLPLAEDRAARRDEAQAAPPLQRAAARAGGGPRARPPRARGLPLGERRGDLEAGAQGRRARAAGRSRVRWCSSSGAATTPARRRGRRPSRRSRPSRPPRRPRRRWRAWRSTGCRRTATTARASSRGRRPWRTASTWRSTSRAGRRARASWSSSTATRRSSDAALLAVLPKPGSLEFFEALDPRSARISGSVRLAYAAIGHLRARVSTPRTSFDAGTGRLDGHDPGARALRLDGGRDRAARGDPGARRAWPGAEAAAGRALRPLGVRGRPRRPRRLVPLAGLDRGAGGRLDPGPRPAA